MQQQQIVVNRQANMSGYISPLGSPQPIMSPNPNPMQQIPQQQQQQIQQIPQQQQQLQRRQQNVMQVSFYTFLMFVCSKLLNKLALKESIKESDQNFGSQNK